MTTMMNMMMNQRQLFPHQIFTPLMDVESQNVQFAFQEDALSNSYDLDGDDEDIANDIDEFTSLLASVEDDEAAKDIDAFTDLIETLSKNQTQEVLVGVSIDDLLPEPGCSNNSIDDLFIDLTKHSENDMEIVEIDDSSDEYDSDEDEIVGTNEVPAQIPLSVSHARAFLSPIDPRCCIKTPIFSTVDSRIPQVCIPKMDAFFGMPRPPVEPSSGKKIPLASSSTVVSTSSTSVEENSEDEEQAPYVHDPARCWVCKSGKSEERKLILHRFVEKRYRRNWKRGARYKARSRVASSRVREGGRFVTKCQWFAPNYD